MSYFKTTDHVNIFYEVNGQGIPIIFIHGFSESGDIFKIQKKVLSKKYKVISYDLRGHGKSDIVEFGLNMKRLSMDLKELIDHLGLTKYIVVAWSMGVSILFEYINIFGTNRLDKICIIDKSPKMINNESWNLGLYHGNYSEEDFEKDLNLLKEDFNKFSKQFIGNMSVNLKEIEFQIGLEKIKKNSPKVLYGYWKSMGQQDYRDTLKNIDIETLIVFGEKSKLYSTEVGEYLKDNIKKSKLEILKESGHLLVLENPRKFNKILVDFIESRD